MIKRYRSKVDLWLVIVILIIVCAPLTFDFSWQTLLIVLILLAIISFITIPIDYTINGNMLRVRSNTFLHSDYKIADIQRIASVKSIASAPAWSLDRLELKMKDGGRIILSPIHKLEFIHDLSEINKDIEIRLS